MLYRKTNFLVGMILTAAMLMVTGTASAQAEEVPVFGGQTTECVDNPICDPGTSRTDEEGITHVRGQILFLELTGDLEGFVIQIIDFNIDFATGNGDLHGSALFVGTLKGVEGVLAGHFDSDVSGFFFSAESSAHGTFGGAAAHSNLTTSGFFGTGVADYAGTVLFPHGQ